MPVSAGNRPQQVKHHRIMRFCHAQDMPLQFPNDGVVIGDQFQVHFDRLLNALVLKPFGNPVPIAFLLQRLANLR